MKPEKFLKERVAIVTGGTSGIGRAIAIAIAEAGADVAVGSRSAATSSCKAEIEAKGVKALAVNLDVSSTDSVQAFYDSVVKTFGKVDILVNSAGTIVSQTMCNHSDELWQETMEVNLNGVYRTIKVCLPGMIERRWGRIINIASISSVADSSYVAYCASKAAVVGLSRCVAREGAAHGVSCNTISPGFVETPGSKTFLAEVAKNQGRSLAEYIEEFKQNNPQKRVIQPEEIAALALFLCRDEAFGITMQDITLSAGGF
ncbi:SDR family oxidoreductase [Planktothrix sp. FACHB-1355]|uniref:SDR family oxidoreductase n=1 Tax=Aerosakkonema funiforme FACHB-1375 TaxID=2949571 RepID=A0A926VKS2_9CYAN|nr:MULTISPECIES: SDR family oxidoreductase [Oscillatoriales]MBD2185569.1 SDR family oxidoreductase [Aerosakkonema funiforme FACHB-1375]MBD3561139.1 SDR family oxidoreductase [Planktothrix sp. FACHB-1355]